MFLVSVTQGGGDYALPWANMLRPYRAKMLAPNADICVDTFAPRRGDCPDQIETRSSNRLFGDNRSCFQAFCGFLR